MGQAPSSPVLVLDTETTGLLDQRLATVVEVGAAAIDFDGGRPARVREVVSFLVNPGEAYLGPEADEALAINRITREEIRARGLAPREAAARLGKATLEERPTAVAAFGVQFDKPMLARPPLGWTTPLPWVDVMLKAAEVIGSGWKARPASRREPQVAEPQGGRPVLRRREPPPPPRDGRRADRRGGPRRGARNPRRASKR